MVVVEVEAVVAGDAQVEVAAQVDLVVADLEAVAEVAAVITAEKVDTLLVNVPLVAAAVVALVAVVISRKADYTYLILYGFFTAAHVFSGSSKENSLNSL